MKVFALSLLAVVSISSAQACSLGEEATAPVIEKRSDTVAKYSMKRTGSAKKGFHVVEKATMGDGWKVTYEAGGCEHFAQSFAFEKFGDEDLDTKEEILTFTQEKLSHVPVKDPSMKEVFFKALEKARASEAPLEDGIVVLPCGDANCAVDASEDGKVKIQYDFAL